MKSKLINISLIVFFVLMLITIYYQKRELVIKTNIANEITKKTFYLSNLLKANWINNYFEISEKSLMINQSDSISWAELNSCEGIMVYRLPVIGCTECFEERFRVFRECADSLNLKVIIVTNITEERNLINFKRLSKYKGDIYFSKDVIPELDILSTTYVFLYELNNIVSVFVPDINFPECTKMYLESIKDRQKKRMRTTC